MHRYFIVFPLVCCLLFTGCSSAPVPDSEKEFETIIELPGMDRMSIYDKANIWAVRNLNADIQYENAQTGTIAGTFSYGVSIKHLLYQATHVKCIFTVSIKEGKARLNIRFAEFHITSNTLNIDTWKDPSSADFEKCQFEKKCSELSDDIAQFEKSASEKW